MKIRKQEEEEEEKLKLKRERLNIFYAFNCYVSVSNIYLNNK